jgi:glycine betaine/choline ABC-type transport system substrate-binding protein
MKRFRAQTDLHWNAISGCTEYWQRFAGKISADEMRWVNDTVVGKQRNAVEVVHEFHRHKGF